MRAVGAVALLVVMALGGCADAPADPGDVAGKGLESPDVSIPPLLNVTIIDENPAVDVDFSAESCQGTVLWLNVNLQLLQAVLPKEYIAADAQELAGPTAKSQGLATIETFSCAKNSLGSEPLSFALFLAYVKQPTVGESLPAVKTNWYELILYTSTPSFLSVLKPLRPIMGQGPVKSAVAWTGGVAATGEGEAQDEKGKVFSTSVAGGVSSPGSESSRRVWHDAPKGTLHFDYAIKTDLIQGAGRCDVRQGSMVYDVAKTNSCLPQDNFGSWIWDAARWQGRLVYAPKDL